MLYQFVNFNWFSRPFLAVMTMVLLVFFLIQAKPPQGDHSDYNLAKIDLSQYQLTEPSIAIKEIDDNASGLTYNPDSKTLFMVVNEPEKILELDTQGRTLRQIELIGFADTEGIIYLGKDTFAVTEERQRTLALLTISAQTTVIHRAEALSFQFSRAKNDNKGFEGLTYDFRYNFFYIANEKHPSSLIAWPDPRLSATRLNYQILRDVDQQLNSLNDIAGLHLDKQTGNLLVLSEESKLVIETNLNGQRISHLNLSSSQSGLVDEIPQPEGITMDGQGRVYICSEPNLLYIFDRKAEDNRSVISEVRNKENSREKLLITTL